MLNLKSVELQNVRDVSFGRDTLSIMSSIMFKLGRMGPSIVLWREKEPDTFELLEGAR
jgi:hypothetical protein